MSVIISSYLFLVGAALGSFSNMLVYRLNIRQNIWGYSYCDKTKKRLEIIDLFPMLSYLIFRGKCRDCGAKLSPIYPIVELLNAIFLPLLFINFELKQQSWMILIASYLILQIVFILGVYDLHYWKVPQKSYVYVCIAAIIMLLVKIALGLDIWEGIIGGSIALLILSIIMLAIKNSGLNYQEVIILVSLIISMNYYQMLIFFISLVLSGTLIGLLKTILNQEHILHSKIQLFPFVFFALLMAYLM